MANLDNNKRTNPAQLGMMYCGQCWACTTARVQVRCIHRVNTCSHQIESDLFQIE